MSQADRHDASAATDRAVERLRKLDEKVDEMRAHVNNDPDSLGDKLVKLALPSVTGLVAGKLFDSVRDARSKARNSGVDQEGDGQGQGTALASVAFAALSAAFTAVVSELSDRGSQALIDRRHQRTQNKH
ncbi:hypothetical protein BACT_0088 [Bifidobacterium actinocoloniiforme DSM 22766]|uniref:Uncharacterized protein n=1 Tax=Bifidobacterium actinocoloniiforme DSM 22766 TaxID=1437605 RepID=A0A086YYA8_9BIFI|nr:DUF4235 domain-containing protein [Bifidobacterium actinocoloniiforme]AKV55823.1 hypothetical protein AB656_06265 [Bifidobacterium actinocoloniiforme DSM 22766]KFI39258.1 hypothetical protein BACT_0088 [Bifidobacterium actinocoloniiforme DSM 22766]